MCEYVCAQVYVCECVYMCAQLYVCAYVSVHVCVLVKDRQRRGRWELYLSLLN